MRRSKVLEKLRKGEKTSCFKVNLKDAQVTELAGKCGFDCIWVDQEHIGQDWSIISSHVWASKSQDVDLMVRVARGSYSDYWAFWNREVDAITLFKLLRDSR